MTTMPWMTFARAQLGVREAAGPENNPRILSWAQKLGVRVLGIPYVDDTRQPWCGLFCAYAVAAAGLRPPALPVRARQWALWGEETEPCEGAVLVFERGSGAGHVGFYEAERPDAFLVLGGNQSDAVTRAWIPKNRLMTARWPHGHPRTKPVLLDDSLALLSRTEA